MSMPFYVAPEQVMKDKADYARKGIARGRSLVAVTYANGILLCAQNHSRTLHKINEIYDRIAFAGVGKFNEYDQLRQAGVRHADIKGYQYSREDVDARSLANAYAQSIGHAFTDNMKPLEIEILIAEVGLTAGDDQLYRVLYDGTVMDEQHFSVLGGESEQISERLEEAWQENMTLNAVLKAGVESITNDDDGLEASEIEAAVLDRTEGRRMFRRISTDEIAASLA